MEAEDVYYLRSYKKSDINFIQNSWGSSYYKGAEHINDMAPREFNAIHRPIRDKILANPNATVVIACSSQDEDLILGWILVEKPETKGLILHYLYIKQAFKGEGIADKLLNNLLTEEPIIVTHMTDRAAKIIKNKKNLFDTYFYSPQTIMLKEKFSKILQQLGEKHGT